MEPPKENDPDKSENSKKSLKTPFKIAEMLAKIWIAIPIIFGILFPMIYMVPLIFSSWWLFLSFEHTSWMNCYLRLDYANLFVLIPLIIAEITVFITGCLIFLKGLYALTKARLRKDKSLATNGIYKYIRHPQNIGILLIMLPLSLYNPIYYDIGIRIGELLSWSLLVVLIAITSQIEERKLLKLFGNEYTSYSNTAGFFVPKLVHSSKKYHTQESPVLDSRSSSSLNYSFLIKLVIGYLGFLVLMFIVVQILKSGNLVFWTR